MAIGNKTRWVALLRGVNVGGVKVLMEPLRALAKNLGWTDVQTYIASGNLVFSARGSGEELAEQLRSVLIAHAGVDTPIIVLPSPEILAVLDKHPWNPEKGNQSHVYFCWDIPVIDQTMYRSLKSPDEELLMIERHVHFYAPAGLGRSKLADNLGKVIKGTEITGRNLNTVRKLVQMVSD